MNCLTATPWVVTFNFNPPYTPSLSPPKHLDAPIPTNKVQQFRLLDRPILLATTSSRDPQHPADVARVTRVKQPQTNHRLRGMRQPENETRVLLLQCRGLRRDEGLVCGNGDDGGMDFLDDVSVRDPYLI